jgi:hypothetical protein
VISAVSIVIPSQLYHHSAIKWMLCCSLGLTWKTSKKYWPRTNSAVLSHCFAGQGFKTKISSGQQLRIIKVTTLLASFHITKKSQWVHLINLARTHLEWRFWPASQADEFLVTCVAPWDNSNTMIRPKSKWDRELENDHDGKNIWTWILLCTILCS